MTLRIRPASLRCEYRIDPLGVGVSSPFLSWVVESPQRGGKQSAFQILAATSPQLLAAGKTDLWDSRAVQSPRTCHVPYQGRPLSSAQRVWWKVRVWDEHAPTDWSEPANFTTGLLHERDWKAKWIIANPETDGSTALPQFRREFDISKPPKRALVFICGLGHFELRINGNKVGDSVLDPGWTNYSKTCLYVTHDITPSLRQGPNTLGVILGNGMYSVLGTRYKKFKASFGPLKLILQMLLTYEDGSVETIVTNNSWKSAPGPIRFSCIFGGEDFDARRETPGWDLPGFSDQAWKNAAITASPGGSLIPQSAPPIAVMHTIDPVRATAIANDVAVYDFGKNVSGWPQITTEGQPGATVNLITGELLDSTGRVSQKSSGTPVSFSFTTAGARQTWQPKFSYTGFRYLEARGDITLIKNIAAHFVHTSARVVGSFKCSNPLFNDIHALINAAILSNLQSVITDCPHREKLGWLEQSHLMAEAIMFNYDVPLLYRKICRDMRDAQHPDGCVPTIAPEFVKFKDQWADFSNSPEWGSAAIINPWLMFQHYGDARIVDENFEMMRRYAEYLHRREQNGIIDFGLGDWYDIGPGDPGYSKLTSKAFTATAIYFHDLQIMQKAAALLQKPEETERYAARASQVREAFHARFFNERTGQFDRNSQAASGMALALGLVHAAHQPRVLENLVHDIRQRQNHITAGDIGFRFVLEALAKSGRSDVIYDLLSRTDPPSYGAQLHAGATTLTEAWDANPAKSQNHLMLGHAELWFYQTLAGIRLDLSKTGDDRLLFHPAMVGNITWAEASYESVLGKIAARWQRENQKFTLSIEVPFNTAAKIHIPARNAQTLKESGRPIDSSPHLRLISAADGTAVLSVDGGQYFFESELPQQS